MPSPAAARIEVRASAALESITAATGFLGAFGLVERLQGGTDKAITCQLAGLASGGSEQLRIFDTNLSLELDGAAHALVAGKAVELRLRRNTNAYDCHATDPVLQVGASSLFAPATSRIGLRVRAAIARYHWIMVVTSP
jgi:hypothetical protein